MPTYHEVYEAVIGLEVHTQLLTESKAYCADSAAYGGSPNTQVSPISLGHPGTLPVPNERVMEFAVRLGLAVKADIREHNEFARKNYFYADLPKGYQVTQDTTPICTGGFIEIKDKDGKPKKIRLTRIHMEEDSGKSIHDLDPFNTLIDLNRAGVPLLEIVSEADLADSTEAYNYLTEVRKLVRYLDICDGNMEEGSMRCDANISVKRKDTDAWGTKVEVKNMNSIRNVQRALQYEFDRQIEAIEKGEEIFQETRTFDAATGKTFVMRTKEDAHDYRYFPEPDLQPIKVEQSYIDQVLAELPPLPQELFRKYLKEYQLSEYDAGLLTDTKEIALYFEEIIKHTNNYKAAANWIMGSIKSYLNEQAITMNEFNVPAEKIAALIKLVDDNLVSNSVASQKVFPKLIENPEAEPKAIAEENNWIQSSDSSELEGYIKQAIAKYPEKVAEYNAGKKGLVGLFMGEVMKLSRGQADPKTANKLLINYLEKEA